MTTALITLLVAAAFSFAATPVVRSLAHRFGYLDKPDGGRKIHSTPIPFGGGIAVFVALVTAVGIVMAAFADQFSQESDLNFWGMVAFASALLVAVGIWDDSVHMRGRHKLGLQAAIALGVIFTGLDVSCFDVFGWQLTMGPAGKFFTLLWILGSINAFNLIDGVDGVASVVGAVLSISIGAVAFMNGNFVEATIAMALTGALLGFLPYNFAPATIFLGDAGSMLIGFVLGVLAISGSTKEAATVAAAPLLAIWTILILDSVAAFARRILTGTSIYVGDRGHIHHKFLIRGLGARRTALAIGGLCAVTSVAAIVGEMINQDFLGLLVAVGVVGVLAGSRQFGDTEARLLGKRIIHAGRGITGRSTAVNSSLSLQGDERWDDIWAGLTEAAERFDVVDLRLNLCIPSEHQRYFGSWSAGETGPLEAEKLWSFERPIRSESSRLGTVSAKGRPVPGQLVGFVEFLESLDGQISDRVRTDAVSIPVFDAIGEDSGPIFH